MVLRSRMPCISMIQSQAESAETCDPTYLILVQWLCNPYLISHIVSSPNCQSYLVYLKIHLINDLLLDNDWSNELGDGVENIKSIFGAGTCPVSCLLFLVLALYATYAYTWPLFRFGELGWWFADELWQNDWNSCIDSFW